MGYSNSKLALASQPKGKPRALEPRGRRLLENEMREQTDKLCASLPCLAPVFQEADSVGQHNWYIVRFDVPPTEVKPEQFRVIKASNWKNEFSSRTAALRASEVLLRPVKEMRSEKGHWGVWCVNTGKRVYWQSVLPLKRAQAEAKEEGNAPSNPQSKAPSEPLQMAKRLEPLQIAAPVSPAPSAEVKAEKPDPKAVRAAKIAEAAKAKREEMAKKAEEVLGK